jgi:hypothetical protein
MRLGSEWDPISQKYGEMGTQLGCRSWVVSCWRDALANYQPSLLNPLLSHTLTTKGPEAIFNPKSF